MREIEKKANLALISKNDSNSLIASSLEPSSVSLNSSSIASFQQTVSNKLNTKTDDDSTMLVVIFII